MMSIEIYKRPIRAGNSVKDTVIAKKIDVNRNGIGNKQTDDEERMQKANVYVRNKGKNEVRHYCIALPNLIFHS